MSFRDESEDLNKPLLHTGSWYRMGSSHSSIMSSRQGSTMGPPSAQTIRDRSVSVVLCVLIVALGPIQFGFTVTPLFPLSITISLYKISCSVKFLSVALYFSNVQCGYTSPTQEEMIDDLGLSLSEV
jgi:SP family sugar porter-like MFS transporter